MPGKGQRVVPGSLKGGKKLPTVKAPLGGGERFKALAKKLSKNEDVENPNALAAALGRAKMGSKAFAKAAAKGRKT